MAEKTNQEVNEAVARKLGGDPPGHPEQPDYVGSIAAAWEIVEHLRTKNIGILVESDQDEIGKNPGFSYWCEITNHPECSGYANTAPLAICLAFLKLP